MNNITGIVASLAMITLGAAIIAGAYLASKIKWKNRKSRGEDDEPLETMSLSYHSFKLLRDKTEFITRNMEWPENIVPVCVKNDENYASFSKKAKGSGVRCIIDGVNATVYATAPVPNHRIDDQFNYIKWLYDPENKKSVFETVEDAKHFRKNTKTKLDHAYIFVCPGDGAIDPFSAGEVGHTSFAEKCGIDNSHFRFFAVTNPGYP